MDKINIALRSDEPSRAVTIHRFEELFELSYFPQLEFADWEVESWIRHKCAWAHKKGYIGQLALWLGKLHGHQIEEGDIKDITIRWINENIGYGAFTERPFKKWEFIGEYTGLLRRRSLLFSDLNDYCFMYPREWVSYKLYAIDSADQGNFTRFINHSDFPNLESVAVFKDGLFHIIFRAIQDILPGSQLSYDYGDVYWNTREKVHEREPVWV